MKDEDLAFRIARRANNALAYKRENMSPERRRYWYPISSVAYAGGHYAAHVFEDTAPRSFPDRRPHYE